MEKFDELLKETRLKQEINLKKITVAERNIRENRSDLERLGEIKYDQDKFETYREQMVKEHDALVLKIDDVFNRLVTQEIYLEKYLPYNSYVQLSELLHVALDLKQISKFEDFE